MEYREGGGHVDPHAHAPPGADEADPSGRGRWVCRQCDQYSFDSYYDMIHHEQTECQAVPRHYQQPGAGPDPYAQPYPQGPGAPTRSGAPTISRDYRSSGGGGSGGPSRRIRQPQDSAHRQQHYDHPQYYLPQASPPPAPLQESSTAAVSPVRRRVNPSQQTGVHDSGGSHSSESRSVSFSPGAAGVSSNITNKPPSNMTGLADQLLQRPEQLSNLLTLEEMNSLSEQDRMLCQSVAIFVSRQQQHMQQHPSKGGGGDVPTAHATSQQLATNEQVQPQVGKTLSSISTHQQQQGGGGYRQGPLPPAMLRIIGLQCVYCTSSRPVDDRPDPTCLRIFPGSVETLGSSLYLMKERHFRVDYSITKAPTASSEADRGCPCAPPRALRVLQQSPNKAAMSPEQRYHETMMLQSVCNGFSHRLGIVNNHPYRTGIILEGPRQYAAEPGLKLQQPPPPPYYGGLYESPSREETDYRSGPQSAYPYGSSAGDRYGSSRTPTLAPIAASTASSSRGPPPSSAPPRGNPPVPPPYGSGPEAVAAGRPPPSFYYDGYGWACPHCATIPYHMRAPGSFYRDPPSTEFVERHFSVCTGISSDPWNYERGMPPPSYPPGYQPPPYPAPPAYYSSPGSGAPPPLPPPGWRMGGHPNEPPPPYYPQPPYGRPEYGYPPYPPARDMRPAGGGPPEYYYPPMGVRGEPVPPQATSTDASFQAAIKLLSNLEDVVESNEEPLVLPEDKALLTDYFYFVNKQLKLCRFTEGDRKTRGGKRETIEVGFGGLECRHCAGSSGSRKFFWSDVDRLANSFAEIPGHILKCRKCPENVKQSLSDLKGRHPEQMARLPRGSQKVFFRRMWKRLHNNIDAAEVKQEVVSSEQLVGSHQETRALPSSEQLVGDHQETRALPLSSEQLVGNHQETRALPLSSEQLVGNHQETRALPLSSEQLVGNHQETRALPKDQIDVKQSIVIAEKRLVIEGGPSVSAASSSQAIVPKDEVDVKPLTAYAEKNIVIEGGPSVSAASTSQVILLPKDEESALSRKRTSSALEEGSDDDSKKAKI